MQSIIQYLENVLFFFFRNSKPFKSYKNKKVAYKKFCNRPPFWYLRTRPGSFVRYTLRFFDYPSLMTSDIVLYHFLILEVFLRSTSMLHQQHFFLIFVECLPHEKFNSGHFMKSKFLALYRHLRRYSEKTKKSAVHGFYFASNRKSLPTIVLKTQGSYFAGDNVSVDKWSTFLGNIFKFRPFLALTPRL